MSEKQTYYENEYVQIMSAAPGWVVAYQHDEPEPDGSEYFFEPIACFALVRRLQKECFTAQLLKDEGLDLVPIVGGDDGPFCPIDISQYRGFYGPDQERPGSTPKRELTPVSE